jgi:riboflavin synthase
MFTGIVEEVGRVRSSERGTLIIEYSDLDDIAPGDSIAVNGCDLTVTDLHDGAMTFNCMPETYRRTNLGELRPGDPVNLERSVTPSTRLSGQIVRGVVEATGRLVSLTPEEDAVLARFEAPPDILRHTIVKGPVTIDGVSLTVVAKDDTSFTVSLVQYTQRHTNIMDRKPGDTVNLESDIIARYVDQLLEQRAAS